MLIKNDVVYLVEVYVIIHSITTYGIPQVAIFQKISVSHKKGLTF